MTIILYYHFLLLTLHNNASMNPYVGHSFLSECMGPTYKISLVIIIQHFDLAYTYTQNYTIYMLAFKCLNTFQIL